MVAEIIITYVLIAITGLVICIGLYYIDKIQNHLHIKNRARRQARDHLRDHQR